MKTWNILKTKTCIIGIMKNQKNLDFFLEQDKLHQYKSNRFIVIII